MRVNASLHWCLIDPQQDGNPVPDPFKKLHSIFCVRGNLPGDSILEQFVRFFLGKKNNGMVCCTLLGKSGLSISR